MKAIVMAGGEGTRLRPLTNGRPKPMMRLLDRPILEYILHLLRRNGADDICLTLKYLPDAITSYFGDGAPFGVRLQSRVEKEALGTAGSVRSCLDFIGDDDVLVISGDCVCDFDLSECVDFHRQSGAEATIVLYSHPDPTEYGAVVTGDGGRIERFCEKPAWENVVTGDISTGIYILSPSAVRSIPEGTPYDFGRDLFPELLLKGRGLYAVRAEGYWCDVGSPDEYLKCCADALSGRVRLPFASPKLREGVWTLSPLPGGCVAAPPVYIGENVRIEPGAHIGPNAIIGSGSRIAGGASVKNSVIDGAVIMPGASAEGAIVGEGASVGEGSALLCGSIAGDRCVIGKSVTVSERSRIWPELEIPDGTRITESVRGGMPKSAIFFSGAGEIRGGFGSLLTPEACIAIGSAAASFGAAGIAHDGSPAAAALAGAISAGAVSAGGRVVLMDAPYPAAAAFGCGLYGLAETVFLSVNDGDAMLSFFGSDGFPVSRVSERRFEAALRGDVKRAAAHAVGNVTHVSGVCDAYSAAASEPGAADGVEIAVSGRGIGSRTLRAALLSSGCKLVEPRRGIPVLSASPDGFSLYASDENGLDVDPDRMLLITALSAFSTGVSELAVPSYAPSAMERLASSAGGHVLRVGRDGIEAERLVKKQPFMRFAVFSAVLICRAMRELGVTLSKLRDGIPAFSTAVREVPVVRSRGEAMSALHGVCAEFASELSDGFAAIIGDTGRVRITPCRGREALIIHAEGDSEELAEELCADFERRIRKLD